MNISHMNLSDALFIGLIFTLFEFCFSYGYSGSFNTLPYYLGNSLLREPIYMGLTDIT